MANKQPQIVTIDGNKYAVEDLSDQAKLLIDHVADLDRKLASMDFQRQQLQVGRDAFFSLLKEALKTQPAEAKEVEEAN
jgi:cell division protein ZapA (FtsZ GTPase activity inhibitor)